MPARAGEPPAGEEEAQEDWREKNLGNIYLKNIYKEKELDESSTARGFLGSSNLRKKGGCPQCDLL